MKFQIITCLCLFLLQDMSAQTLSVRTKNASCTQMCDGRVIFTGLEMDADNEYAYRHVDSLAFHDISSNQISGLCAGRYELRTKKWASVDYRASGMRNELKKGHVHLKSLKLNTYGLRSVELNFEFPEEFDDPNYYLVTFYSVDGGDTWVQLSELFQARSVKGDSQVRNVIKFPRRAENRKEVLINIQQLNPRRKSGVPLLNLMDLQAKGRMIDMLKFDIGLEENMKIRSVVSNEVDTNDGYISLRVSGGTPPYTYLWDQGSTGSEIKNLSPGNYMVKVSDKVGCTESASYTVQQVKGETEGGRFDLIKAEDEHFVMTISSLYRQPLVLILKNASGAEVKTYRINPLYEDLKMSLDLSYLESGAYHALLEGTEFKESVDFSIK